MLRTFGWSFLVTLGGLVVAYLMGGWEVLSIVAILAILEISLSFDNAVVNASTLRRMSLFWQRMFLTVGILIAVFGMRLVFPFVVVGVTAQLGPASVIDLAVNHPAEYAQRLHEAHPAIASFGGMFLLMIFLDFLGAEREIPWFRRVELLFARFGKIQSLSVIIALCALLLASRLLATEDRGAILAAGMLGLVVYLAVSALSDFFEARGGTDESGAKLVNVAGVAGFSLFLYLEVLDASFSFDGVVAAFAVSSDIFVIALGLGIGAMYIRSLTVYLVRAGTLDDYVFLEHGAHYAIGALATLLLVSIRFEIPEVVTGLIGVGLIATAFVASLRYNRRRPPETLSDSDPTNAEEQDKPVPA